MEEDCSWLTFESVYVDKVVFEGFDVVVEVAERKGFIRVVFYLL